MKPAVIKSCHRPLWPTLVCAALLLLVSACKPEAKHEAAPQPAAGPAVEVQVVTVNEVLTSSHNEVVGTVEAVQRATMAAKITGTIAEMPVVLGAMVKQGDLLVTLNAAEISARLSQAETALAQAKRNLERDQRLLAKNAATRDTVNAQEDAYKVAKAAVDEARTMLGYITIRAPFGGLVSKKLANAGDLATVGAPLLIIENTEGLQAVAAVPEAQLSTIKSGDLLPIRIPAADLEATGTVAEIAPAGDAASRTSVVKLNLPLASRLRPGQFVRVILPGGSSKTLLVPESAYSVFGQMERVFVVEENRAHLRLVRSGQRRDGQLEILSGINPGEQVVVQAKGQLQDGQAVRVTP